MKKIKCKKCNMEHNETKSNCCWIDCECGEEICGQCGSSNIKEIDRENLDLSDYSDDQYWCCLYCDDCGLEGCGMCV